MIFAILLLIIYSFVSMIILYVCEEGNEKVIQNSKSNYMIFYIVYVCMSVCCLCMFLQGWVHMYVHVSMEAYSWCKESSWPHFHLITEAGSLNPTQSSLLWLVCKPAWSHLKLLRLAWLVAFQASLALMRVLDIKLWASSYWSEDLNYWTISHL